MDNYSSIPIGISRKHWLKKCIKKSCHNLHILSAEYKHIQEYLSKQNEKKKKTKRLVKKKSLSKQSSNTQQQSIKDDGILQKAFDCSEISELEVMVLENFDTALLYG